MISRRTFISGVPVVPLALLTGCAGTTFVAPTPASLQQALINACGFFAELGPLAQLIANFVPIAGVSTTAAVLAQLTTQLCNAVMPAKTTPMATAGGQVSVVVNGVTIVGKFVR